MRINALPALVMLPAIFLAASAHGQETHGSETQGQESDDSAAPTLDGRHADLRLVVTGGLGGLQQGFERFWTSAVFVRGSGPPLTMHSANASVFRFQDGLFFWAKPAAERSDDDDVSSDLAVRASILAASASAESERTLQRVLLGPGTITLAGDGGMFTGTAVPALLRSLSAVPKLVAIEKRSVRVGTELRTIVGVDLSAHSPLVWPTAQAELLKTPAARATFDHQAKSEGTSHGETHEHGRGNDELPLIFIARAQGATDRTLGVVDQLLTDARVPTLYVDAGGALSGRDPNSATARRMLDLLQDRNPSVMVAAREDLAVASFTQDLLHAETHLIAAAGKGMPPVLRSVGVGDHHMLLSALGGLDAQTRAMLPRGAKALSAADTLAKTNAVIMETHPEVVVGFALSDEGESAALASSNFDAVVRLVPHRTSALASIDDVMLTSNHALGLHAGPSLARVAAGDVTEVLFWLGAGGRVERIYIHRHPVVDDGPRAKDATQTLADEPRSGPAIGLPSRRKMRGALNAWTGQELSQLRAELVRRKLEVEVALLPPIRDPVPVEGLVPAPLARAWLSDSARVITTAIRGKQLSKIFATLKKGGLQRLAVAGASVKAGTVSQRGVAPLEYYDVALTPWVLERLASHSIVVKVDDDALRGAPSISLLIEDALPNLQRPSFCLDLLAAEGGQPQHTLIFEISNLALSGAFHAITGDEGLEAVRDSRVQTPPNFSIGVAGRVGAFYEGPWNTAGIFAESQFNHVSRFGDDGIRSVTETRDVLLFEADVRLKLVELIPWDQAATLLPRPTARLTYQTEWTPKFTIVDGVEEYQPRRSELRALIGFGVSPRPWLRDLRLGILVENDFATPTEGALEFGGEAAISGQWAYEVFRFKLDAFVRGYVPDPARDTADDVGVVSQIIARVEVPIIFDLGISGFVDLYAARGKTPQTQGPVASMVVGAALTYGQRLKWVPFQ